MQLLAENPRASMQDVAEAAGVHRATVHRHFATRDDLIAAVRDRALDQHAALLADPTLAAMPPGAALERITREALVAGDRHRLYRVTATFDDSNDARRDALRSPMAALLTRAQAAGIVRNDLPAPMLSAAWGGLVLVMLPPIAQGTPIDDAVRFILQMLRKPR